MQGIESITLKFVKSPKELISSPGYNQGGIVQSYGFGSFVSSAFKAVGNVVKGVADVAKKVAPIALPIAAAAFGVPFLGPAFGAGTFGASALGGGLGTLIGGGSVKDALRSAALSGSLAGLGSVARGGEFFGSGLAAPTSSFADYFRQTPFGEAGVLKSAAERGVMPVDDYSQALSSVQKGQGFLGRTGDLLGKGLGAAKEFIQKNPIESTVGALGIGTALGTQMTPEQQQAEALKTNLRLPLPGSLGREYIVQGLPGVNYDPYGRIVQQQPLAGLPTAATGGSKEDIQNFPRKTGQISGPGTGTSDSIPAMLSDGEFVMTKRAVAAAGGGSVRKGAKQMYTLMRGLENKGKQLGIGRA
jgi:hypothetical protein